MKLISYAKLCVLFNIIVIIVYLFYVLLYNESSNKEEKINIVPVGYVEKTFKNK